MLLRAGELGFQVAKTYGSKAWYSLVQVRQLGTCCECSCCDWNAGMGYSVEAEGKREDRRCTLAWRWHLGHVEPDRPQ